MALCPGHADKERSLSIKETEGKTLLNCFAGCENSSIVAAVGLSLSDLFDEPARNGNGKRNGSENIIKIYEYQNEAGHYLFEVCRYEPKDFRPRVKQADGSFKHTLNGVRRVLYRLPEILKADAVIIVEGEKDVESVRSMGFTATTSQGGANSWKSEYADSLTGKDIIIIPDLDPPGQKYAEIVSRSLHGKAKSIKTAKLPSGKDISDWAEELKKAGKPADRIKEELNQLIEKAPVWKPEENNGKNSLRFEKIGELLNLPEEEIQWLVEDRLPSGGLSLFVAKPKVGKSTLARCLALAVAQGKPWLNHEVSRGPVLYLALEEKIAEVVKHFKAMGATESDPIFIFAGISPQDGLTQLKETVVTHKPVLVIIDPLFRFTRVKDGNSYTEVTAALEPLIDLARKSGSHVLLVHHGGKGERIGGDSILGSTAIFGSADTAFIMKRTETTRTVYSIQRYGPDLEEIVLTMDEDSGWITASGSKHNHDIDLSKTAILEFLANQSEPIEEKEILDHVEGRKALKVKAVRALVTEGKVERTGEGKKGNVFKYKMLVSLFPTIYGEQGNKNPKKQISSSQSYTDVCSQGFKGPEEKTNSLEQESFPLDREISVLDLEENS